MPFEGIGVCQHKFVHRFSMVVCSTWKVKMFLWVAVLLLLFLTRIHFPRTKSMAAIIWSRYGNKILKMVRKLEESDFKLSKAKRDIKFLCKCENNDMTPNFLRFWTANKNLKDPNIYKQCQKSLLLTEIDMKSHIHEFYKNNLFFYLKSYSQF